MVCECVYMQKRKGTVTYNFFAISASYATDDIGGGASEVISNLNDSFGSRYFLNVMNKRTIFIIVRECV